MIDEDFDFRQIVQLTTAAHAVLDAAFRVVLANDAYCDAVGVSRENLTGANVLELFPADCEHQALVSEAFKTALAGQVASLTELHYAIMDPLTPDMPPRDMWWTLDCIPMRPHPVHGPVFLLRVENVTQEVAARKRRDLFASELQHRIGNVLTLVQIIARKTAQSSADLESFRMSYERRIRALGKTHAFLSGANWDGMTVRQIVEQQIQCEPLERSDAIRISGPEWRMSVLHAQTFAMGVHELIANAADHGALAIPGGAVEITWDRTEDGGHQFIWRESGLHALAEPQETGFGMQMLTRLLPGQLGGLADCTFAPDGFCYRLIVPDTAINPLAR